MKLTVGRFTHREGFALPTILIISTVMIAILVASIAAAAASRVSLDSQYFNHLAQQAAESGIARAKECLSSSGYTPQWSTASSNRNLRPNSDCTGATMTGSHVSAYVVGTGSPPTKVRTKYSIEAPSGAGIGSILHVVGTTELVRTSSPYNAWRTYEQSLYYRIEPPQTIACPNGFVPVPGDSRFGTNDFCIGKYEAKNVGGKAESRADGTPYVNISQTDAIKAASDACAGCHLITEGEWLTVAHNAMNVASNWSGGSVGDGYMYRGHSDNSSGALAASTDDDNGYSGTGNSAPSNQRRTLRLSNGEVVWDLAGNVYEWTTGQVGSGKPGTSGWSFQEWNTVGSPGSISPNPIPSFGTPAASSWTTSNGIGGLYSNSSNVAVNAFRRGGFYANGGDAGVATLALGATPSSEHDYVGFRIVFEPLSEIECSEGFIPVPGNNLFGTKNFCVGKYEAKNVGGKAVSRAASPPWTGISQTSAITAGNNACANCRLISEAEWLTIAHNIANVPSNWSNDSVGSGYVYIGHSDGFPSSSLDADDDDNNGYDGTFNWSGPQRRTLKLNNGETIWDFSGNVWEWTTGQITGGQPGGSNYDWRNWNSIIAIGTLMPDPFPIYATPAASDWTSANGIGMFYSSTSDSSLRAFRRGGGRGNGSAAGIFTLSLGSSPTATSSDIGFRLVEVK